jgi:hypothetical protein
MCVRQLATNRTDGAASVDVADFEGKVQLPHRASPQGLAALELDPYREVALVYAPGAAVAVNKAVITHGEKLKHTASLWSSENFRSQPAG